MRTTTGFACTLLITIIPVPAARAGNQPGKALAVLDGDTVTAAGVDASGQALGVNAGRKVQRGAG
jgi:hypothetical protein